MSPSIAEEVWDDITSEAVVSFQELSGEDEDSILRADEIGIKKFKINHGLKKDHPLTSTKFFDKKGVTNTSYKLDQRKLESMLPKETLSWTVRCYVKPQCDKKFLKC